MIKSSSQGVVASRNRGRSDGAGKERDVLGLMLGNLLEALADVEGEAGLGKRLGVEPLEGAVVKRLLQMLQSQSILKNISVCRMRKRNRTR